MHHVSGFAIEYWLSAGNLEIIEGNFVIARGCYHVCSIVDTNNSCWGALMNDGIAVSWILSVADVGLEMLIYRSN